MQVGLAEKKGLTAAVCPEPGCGERCPVDLRFGIILVHCMSCGNDFWFEVLPAWLKQQLNGKEQKQRNKTSSAPDALPVPAVPPTDLAGAQSARRATPPQALRS